MKWFPMSVHEECWNENTHGNLLQQPLLSQNHYRFSSKKKKKSMAINYFAEIFLNADIFDAIDLKGSVFVSFDAGWSFFFGGWGGQAFPGRGML